MKRMNAESRVPVGTFNNKYVALSTISGHQLCDPTSKFEAEQTAKELGIEKYEVVEWIERKESNIDYSVLDQY